MKNQAVLIAFHLLVAATGLTQEQTGFRHQLTGKNFPWTAAPVVSGDYFRFVILGDLTGGEESGVFNYAIDRINELAPDFVITVGDIVEGYNTDIAEIEKQWLAFDRILEKLEVPFFATPGNHDVTNNLMLEIWEKRWGVHYYSFYVGKSLFVILNSTEPGVEGFSDAQVDLIRTTVLHHPKEYPVFVISHDPFWKMVGKSGYAELNAAFKNYKTTYFCGHEHRYQFKETGGRKHFMLAGLAAGGPGMIGTSLGEFHNLMQVTVRNTEIKVANIELEGLLPVDVVNNNTIKQVDILRSGDWARIEPTVKEGQIASLFESKLLLENSGDYPLKIVSDFKLPEQFSMQPLMVDIILLPNETKQVPVKLLSELPVDIDELPEVSLRLKGKFIQEEQFVEAFTDPEWVIDYFRESLYCKGAFEPDSWEKPAVVEEAWDWDGLDDGSFALNVCHDSQTIFINVRVQDDNVVISNGKSMKGDKLKVFVCSDILLDEALIVFEFMPGNNKANSSSTDNQIGKIETNLNRMDDLLEMNISIPREILTG